MAAKIKSLQEWCQKSTAGYRDVNVINMTTSWRDGLAFCALIHHFKPDILDFNSLSKENVLHNNQMAFRAAESEFGITPLFDAEDILSNKVPDKLAIVTYVSQYYTCFSGMQPIENKSVIRNGSTKDLSENNGNKRKAVPLSTDTKSSVESAAVPTEKKQKFRLCEICKKRIHLVERCSDGGNIYHRQCYRAKSLSEMYTRDKSSPIESNQDEETKKPESASGKSPDRTVDKTTSVPEKVTIDKQDPSESSTETKPENSMKETPDMQNSVVLREENQNKIEINKNLKPEETLAITRNETNNPELKKVIDNEVDITQGDCEIRDGDAKPANTPEKSDEKEQSQTQSVSSITNKPENQPPTESTVLSSDLSATDLKVNIKISVDEGNPGVQSDTEDTDVFPPLLGALTDAKREQDTSSNDSISLGNKESSSSLSPFAPLISELPQAPTAKPRTCVSSSDDRSKEKPRPKPRSNLPSSNSAPDRKQPREEKTESTEDDYDDRFNPFAMSDSGSSDEVSDNKDSYDDALNPFGNELSDDCEDFDTEAVKPHKSLNPFEDDSDEDETEGQNELKKPDHAKPLQMSNHNNFKSSSFHPRTENKASKPAVPPPPPSRKKVHAPSPPQPKVEEKNLQKSFQANSPKHTAPSLQSPKKIPQAVSPGQPMKDAPLTSVKRRAAPNWKSNVEQQMEEMNKLNQSDKKYINRPQDPAPKVSVSSAESPSRRSKQIKSSRPAPGFGFPLVKRNIKSEMTEDDITKEMELLHIQLQDLETKGVQLEDALRDQIAQEDPCQQSEDDNNETLDEWFSLVCKKNKLARREIDLIFLMQQQRLEQEHADVEFKIRKLLNKPDAEKSEKEKEEETKLLEQLMNVVEKRSTLITSVEEARAKEEEEEDDYNKMRMLRIDSPNDSEAMKKKKKNKMKKMFGKRKKAAKASSKTDQQTSPKKAS